MILFLSLALIFTIGVNDVSAAPGDTIYVNNSGGNDNSDGSSWLLAKKSIKNATKTVNNNGKINIADGQYTGINNTQISINKNMVINGQNKKNTIINGTGTNWIFNIQNGINFTITNLTLTQGTTAYGGGAIDNNGTLKVNNINFNANTADCGGAINNHKSSILIVNNCNFSDNHARLGGAIYNFYGSMTVTSSNFSGNTAKYFGGAIFNEDYLNKEKVSNNDHNTTIKRSIFTNNTADCAGAIYNWGNLILTYNNFSCNTAKSFGGVIMSENGNITINSSIFKYNTAQSGGAILNFGDFIVMGSTFFDNTATAYGGTYGGGAITNYDGNSIVSFCRIINNTRNDVLINGGSCDVDYNWWGSNFYKTNPVTEGRVVGTTVYKWLVLTSAADKGYIYLGDTSKITADLLHDQDGVYQNPADGHVPDGTPVFFNTDLGNIDSKITTTNGAATATMTTDETEGIAHVNVKTDSQTVNIEVTVNDEFRQSNLYLIVTPNKTNPSIGEIVIYTIKVGNKGPGTAKNVVMTYTIPNGLEFAGATVDNGTYTFNPHTKTIIWTLGDVLVGDPFMDLSLRIVEIGQYLIDPTLRTSTYDPKLNQNTQSITVNPTNQVITTSISMQNTGTSLAGMALAILLVLGGLLSMHKK